MKYPRAIFIFTVGIMAGWLIARQWPLAVPPSPAPARDRMTAAAPSLTAQPTVTATVSAAQPVIARVIDGDTVVLADGRKVRYLGIDSPETNRDECFAAEAKAANERLVLNKAVRLERDVSETDRYGRLLRYVYVGDTFVNLALVHDGFATVVTYPPDVRESQRLRAATAEARAAKRGLWAGCPTSASRETPTIVNFDDRQNLRYDSAVSVGPEDGCIIKGNINAQGEKIYHLPGCGSYEKTTIDETRGEQWFCTEAEATAAGWRKAGNCP